LAVENVRIGNAFVKSVTEKMDKAGVLIPDHHLPAPPCETIKAVTFDQSRDDGAELATKPD